MSSSSTTSTETESDSAEAKTLLAGMDASQLLGAMIQHVETDLLLGADVSLPEQERVQAYSQIFGKYAGSDSGNRPQAHRAPQAAQTGPGQANSSHPTTSHGRGSPSPAQPTQPAQAAQAPQASPAQVAIKPPEAITPDLDPQEKQEKLEQLSEMVSGCQSCPLHQARKQTVFGEGYADSDLMFVGEGPGQTEDELGRPFVGKAGALLDKMIGAMGYDRSDVYIANVVKCRPPNNRTPTPIECQTCQPYLLNQIAIIQPKVIVTLGGPASKTLIGTTRGITAIRGNWHTFSGLKYLNFEVPLMPTFHPAYLLRSYTHENRAKVWSDLQQAMAKLKES